MLDWEKHRDLAPEGVLEDWSDGVMGYIWPVNFKTRNTKYETNPKYEFSNVQNNADSNSKYEFSVI